MIGRNELQVVSGQILPQCFLMTLLPIAHRRRANILGSLEIGFAQVVPAKEQVLRTGLTENVAAPVPGNGHLGHRLLDRHVDDIQRTPG